MGCYYSTNKMENKGKIYYKITKKFSQYKGLESILENEKLIGINKKENSIYLINYRDNIECKIKNISYLSRGQYNYVYDTDIDKMKNIVITFYKNDFLKNDKQITDFDIKNFVVISQLHNILSLEKKYVPELYSSFYMVKNNKLLLCRIIEKLDITAFKYFIKKKNTNEWFNFLFQISYKLKYYQEKYNFNHCDLSTKNIMGKFVNECYIKYEIDEENIYISNCGIEWYFIDFGFSMIEYQNVKYFGEEYFKGDELNFKSEKDLTLMCYNLIYYAKNIPKEINQFIINCIPDINIKNNYDYEIIEKRTIKKLSSIELEKINDEYVDLFSKLNDIDYQNMSCIPSNFLNNLLILFKTNNNL